MKRFHGLTMLVLATLLFSVAQASWGGGQRGSGHNGKKNVIFAIGKEDQSDAEFASSGFTGKDEYRCEVGVDCTANKFPQRHERQGNRDYDANGVQRIYINFVLDSTYRRVFLRLARAGGETTVVKVDSRKAAKVTSAMLGSNEGYQQGAYDLALGKLQKGKHTIELTVANDGKGNGSYIWDAIELFRTP